MHSDTALTLFLILWLIPPVFVALLCGLDWLARTPRVGRSGQPLPPYCDLIVIGVAAIPGVGLLLLQAGFLYDAFCVARSVVRGVAGRRPAR